MWSSEQQQHDPAVLYDAETMLAPGCSWWEETVSVEPGSGVCREQHFRSSVIPLNLLVVLFIQCSAITGRFIY